MTKASTVESGAGEVTICHEGRNSASRGVDFWERLTGPNQWNPDTKAGIFHTVEEVWPKMVDVNQITPVWISVDTFSNFNLLFGVTERWLGVMWIDVLPWVSYLASVKPFSE